MPDGSTVKQFIIYGFSLLLIVAGLGALLEGGIGLLGGPILTVTGLLLLPTTRPFITDTINSVGGPDLSTIGRGTFIVIIIVGFLLGGALLPAVDSPSTDGADSPISPSNSTDSVDSTEPSQGDSDSTSDSSPNDTSDSPETPPDDSEPSDNTDPDSDSGDDTDSSDSSLEDISDSDSDDSTDSSSDSSPDDAPDSGSDDDSNSSSDSSSDGSSSSDSPDDSTDSSSETSWTVTVVSVTDGDTMDVRMPDGSTDTIRLLGVDTPETSTGSTDPTEWEDIPDNADGREWLANWGGQASDYAEERLAGQEIYIEVDEQSDRRGTYDRLLAYAYQSQSSSKSFNMRLLENGYARMYDSQFTQRSEYQSAEFTARNNNIGVWDYTEPPESPPDDGGGDGDLVVSNIHAEAAGNDHENLNGEYVELTNEGGAAVDMTGWTLADEADHTFYFPSGFELDTGESVTIYSGSGSNSDSELYWGSGRAIWNNSGDTIVVTDGSGEVIINREY